MRRLCQSLATLAAAGVLCALGAQTVSPTTPHAAPQAPTPPRAKPVYPVEVELLHGLNAAKLRAGEEVPAKLRQDWTDGVCTLRRNAVIPGEIAAVDEVDGHPRKLAVIFRYRCDERPLQRLLWIALLAPDQLEVVDTHGNPVKQQSFRASSFGEGDPSKPSGVLSGDMSGRSNPSLPLFIDHRPEGNGRPTAVKTGEVWHLPKLTMEVGTGPKGSSVLTTTENQLKVPGHAVLVLVQEKLVLLPEVAKTPAPHLEEAKAIR